LIRNLIDAEEEDQPVSEFPSVPGQAVDSPPWNPKEEQITLFGSSAPQLLDRPEYPLILSLPTITEVATNQIAAAGIGTLVAGLGFEERAEHSFRRAAEAASVRNALLVRYPEPGRTRAILAQIQNLKMRSVQIDYSRLGSDWVLGPGPVLVDVTGLAKPAIFHAIRDELIRVRCVYVAYTAAEHYFPREEDLAKVLDAEKGDDHHRLLEALRDVLTGEEAPYSCRPLLPPNADETRGRGLCAFSSAKQERLLNLLDDRDYDAVDILVNQADRPRSRVSLIAAEVATQNNRNTSVTVCPAEDPLALLEELGRRYHDWYVARGLNFELGLTGNKMQAVAAAALSAAVKVNQCWYVSPARFDSGRFTIGVGATKYIRIALPTPTSKRPALLGPTICRP
jgi:hypothetical protein